MRRPRVLLAVAVLVQLVVLYAPVAPGEGGVPGLDKVVHVAVFAAVGLTGVRAGLRPGLLLGLLLAHAVVSEVVQAALLPHRDGSAGDAAADACGALLGVLLAARARRAASARRAIMEG